VTRWIALLRAVNVAPRIVKMAELRALCEELGWQQVETYIQSGNIVFGAEGSAGALEDSLEKEMPKRFGFEVPVIIRSLKQLEATMAANPFPAESEAEGNRVLIGFPKRKPASGAAEAILAKAVAGERVVEAGGALWFHYPAGVGTSKLTPNLIDRAAGSPVTARNVRTVAKLIEMATA
jgi:uncharacterized protein (DUF1697 family)